MSGVATVSSRRKTAGNRPESSKQLPLIFRLHRYGVQGLVALTALWLMVVIYSHNTMIQQHEEKGQKAARTVGQQQQLPAPGGVVTDILHIQIPDKEQRRAAQEQIKAKIKGKQRPPAEVIPLGNLFTSVKKTVKLDPPKTNTQQEDLEQQQYQQQQQRQQQQQQRQFQEMKKKKAPQNNAPRKRAAVRSKAWDEVLMRAIDKKDFCEEQDPDFQGFDSSSTQLFGKDNQTLATLPAFGIVSALESFPWQNMDQDKWNCQLPPETECDERQMTAIFMAYNPDRLGITMRQIRKLLNIDQFSTLIKECVLVWNGPRSIDESGEGRELLEFSKNNQALRVVYPLKMGLPNDLMNRYHPDVVQVTTKALLYYDDDGPFYSFKAIEAGFELWKRHSRAQIGAMTRQINYSPRQQTERQALDPNPNDRLFVSHCDNLHDTLEYNFYYFANYDANMVLPSGSMLHSNYLCFLWHPALEEVRKFVLAHPVHPDDITVSTVVSHLGGLAPRVYSRFLNPPDKLLPAKTGRRRLEEDPERVAKELQLGKEEEGEEEEEEHDEKDGDEKEDEGKEEENEEEEKEDEEEGGDQQDVKDEEKEEGEGEEEEKEEEEGEGGEDQQDNKDEEKEEDEPDNKDEDEGQPDNKDGEKEEEEGQPDYKDEKGVEEGEDQMEVESDKEKKLEQQEEKMEEEKDELMLAETEKKDGESKPKGAGIGGICWDCGRGMTEKKKIWGQLRSQAINTLIRYFGSINSGSIGWCEGSEYYKPETDGRCKPLNARIGWLPWMKPDGSPKDTCP